MADAPHVIVQTEGHVATVTLNRPEARNAFGAQMLVLLADAWVAVDADPQVRVVILTGAGGHFCAGSDLKAMAGGWVDDDWSARFKEDPDIHWKALLRHTRLKKPLIAAVEGTAVAGGTEILQGTDIRVAGASAKLGVAEARWGLFPLGGSTVRLRRQIPYTLAMDLLLTGRHITADEALRIGLIGRVVPDGQALVEARKDRRPDRGERTARRPGHQAVGHRDRGPAREGSARPGAGDRLADPVHRGRKGRTSRLHGEAQAGLQGAVSVPAVTVAAQSRGAPRSCWPDPRPPASAPGRASR